MQSYFPGGYVQFEGDIAVGVVEKPLPEEIPSQYVRLVVDYYQNGADFVSALSSLPTSDDQYEKGMNVVMKKGPSTSLKYEGDWATLKYSWHVLNMQEYAFTHMLKTYIDPSAVVHNTASIEGEVYIGKNVHIGAFVKISGPCVIGDNVIVGDHSLIRRSTVCKNGVVGSGCEVARSYLASGVMLHRNYVGDSVLGEGVSMGAGAVTANYRFDHGSIKTPVKQIMVDSGRDKFGLIAGDGVKIGVNASTYPGVKLSPGTVVFPGDVVKKDI
jgi:bifunctional UDP-N-acetylglucosamine pyrophosphorylase/glucosamine-1-phosphate N-acetyltransferase